MFFSRRDFLRDSAALSAVAVTLGQIQAQEGKQSEKKENKFRPKVSHIRGYAEMPETEVVMLCDVDQRVAEKGIKRATDSQERTPAFVQDLRRVLDDKNVDAVSIATPNHWHALASIWAMQAGKDVYVEKPVSHNVSEGRRMVVFARKLNRIVQTGTQSRSQSGMREMIDYIHRGKIGAVKMAYGTCYKPRGSIGNVTSPQKVPETLDYNLWCGPAAIPPCMVPFIMIGIGSGTPGTAIWATRVSMKWIRHAGV
ncbi:MAG TPA: Gfo/Idh/MocA family oxidoreductase [Gemmatales bacterium]|nr:Gfo/Idh/MocA family oxidoreductase [Gemmatales bacterium]